MPHQSNKALQSQAPKYAFARSASKYEPGKEAMPTTPKGKGKKPDAWDKAGEYKDYKRTQPSGKPLTRLMKPNQNVQSIMSVVVILLSLPAHLDSELFHTSFILSRSDISISPTKTAE